MPNIELDEGPAPGATHVYEVPELVARSVHIILSELYDHEGILPEERFTVLTHRAGDAHAKYRLQEFAVRDEIGRPIPSITLGYLYIQWNEWNRLTHLRWETTE